MYLSGPYFLLALLVSIGSGYYCYRDAKRHGMDPIRWGAIGLALGLIGLSIYLAKRRDAVSQS